MLLFVKCYLLLCGVVRCCLLLLVDVRCLALPCVVVGSRCLLFSCICLEVVVCCC